MTKWVSLVYKLFANMFRRYFLRLHRDTSRERVPSTQPRIALNMASMCHLGRSQATFEDPFSKVFFIVSSKFRLAGKR